MTIEKARREAFLVAIFNLVFGIVLLLTVLVGRIKYGQYLDGIAQQAGQESTSAQLVRMVKALAFMGVPGLLVLLSLEGFSTLTYLRKERSKSSDER
jgi:hypothetical protein